MVDARFSRAAVYVIAFIWTICRTVVWRQRFLSRETFFLQLRKVRERKVPVPNGSPPSGSLRDAIRLLVCSDLLDS